MIAEIQSVTLFATLLLSFFESKLHFQSSQLSPKFGTVFELKINFCVGSK